jgi:hypothetical protein
MVRMSDMLQLVVWIGNSQCATSRVVSRLECCESRRQAEAYPTLMSHNLLLREPDPGSEPSTDTVRKIAEVVACQVILEISRIEMICHIENL